jgi:hypothetical protein
MNFLVRRAREGKMVREGSVTLVLLNKTDEKMALVVRKRQPVCERGTSSGEVGAESSPSDSLGGVGRSWSGVLKR